MIFTQSCPPYSPAAVIVTGGSSGIGKAFIEHAYRVCPTARICNLSRTKPDEKTARLIHGHVPCDLGDPEALNSAWPQVQTFLKEASPAGEILLINNAGFGVYGMAEDIPATEQLGMMDLNMRGLVDLTLRMLPLLRERGGRVANVASTAAFQPTPFFATYGATKAFVLHWTLALAQELRGTRVSAVAVCPGPTATQFFRRAGMQQGAVGDRLGQTSEQVVTEAWRAITRRRSLIITGWGNKVLATFGSMLPKRLVTRVSARVMAHFRLKQARLPSA
jgi:uncharacterized protein